MRTDIPQSVLDSLANPNGVQMQARLKFYRNRVYCKSGDLTVTSSLYAAAPGINLEKPHSESSIYEPTSDVLITACSDTGVIRLTYNVNETPITPTYQGNPLQCAPWSRPTLTLDDHGLRLFYVESGTNHLKKAAVSLGALVEVGTAECITDLWTVSSTETYKGSLYGISAHEAIYLFIEDGGVGVAYYYMVDNNTPPTRTVAPFRFMFPTEVWNDSIAQDGASKLYWLNYAGAVRKCDELCVYLSMPDGSVCGAGRKANGDWSDIFTAVPRDLTIFLIANVFVDHAGYVHMVGQFVRKKGTPDISAITGLVSETNEHYDLTYNLDLWSEDGRTFSMDRFPLFSTTGHRLMMHLSSYDIQVGNGAMWAELPNYWPTHHDDRTDYLVIDAEDIKKISLDAAGGINISLSYQNGKWITEPLVAKGNIAVLEIGVMTDGEMEWVQVGRCIVNGREYSDAGLSKTFDLNLVSEGIWRVSILIYPMYMEFQSKSSVFDDADELDNLYEAPGSSGIPERFSMDFFAEETAADPLSHAANTASDVFSGDLKDRGLTEYPIVETTSFPMEIKVYGWSRIGKPSMNPNSINNSGDLDDTDTSLPNDTIQPFMVVKGPAETDVERTILFPVSMVATDSATYFPQLWKEGNARATTGNNPIVYTIPSGGDIKADDLIIQVGVKVTSAGAPTVYHIERMDIEKITMFTSDTSIGWKKTPALSYIPGTVLIEGKGHLANNLPPGVTFTLVTGYWEVYESFIADTARTIDVEFNFANPIQNITAAYTFRRAGGYWCKPEIIYYDAGGNVLHSAVSDRDANSAATFRADWAAGTNVSKIRFRITNPYDDGGNTSQMDDMSITFDAPDPETKNDFVLSTVRKCVPTIAFSTRPYSPSNFQVCANYELTGTGAWAGLIGFGKDSHNVIGVRSSKTSMELFKMRAGVLTRLGDASSHSMSKFNIMLEHRDGMFYARIKAPDSPNWPDPQITYKWTYADGPMSMDTLYHVGIYGFIDIPYIRTTPFDSSGGKNVGLLPGFPIAKLDSFPSSGTIEMNGVTYTYAGKTPTAKTPRGPFQFRNIGEWTYSNPKDSHAFSGKTAEITMFEWGANDTHHEDWKGYLLASDSYINEIISETDWKVWITTVGETVWLLNRSRHFGDFKIDGSTNDRAWVTSGLTGIALKAGEEVFHPLGSYCYLANEKTEIKLNDFRASSGDRDSTVADLLRSITQVAGGNAKFPGDKVILNPGQIYTKVNV